jgi:hypothetical protein
MAGDSAIFYLLIRSPEKLPPKIRLLKTTEAEYFNFTPLYLLCLPILTVLLQLALAAPAKEWSRNRAIANASEFISNIESYDERVQRRI